MRTNRKAPTKTLRTHEGGVAARQTPLGELERAVCNCLLYERTFYETGSAIAKRIEELCSAVPIEDVGALAVWARNDLKLRQVPLFLAVQTVKLNTARHLGSNIPQEVLFEVIQRPDELAETLSLYWRDGRQPLAAALKRGLADAFTKFNAYQLAKWNRDNPIKLRDVLFLCHAKPKDAEQDKLWKDLIAGTLPTPDTWEVALSSGADKRQTWERLLREDHLGIMALLMNLRNMTEAQVDPALVKEAILRKAPGSRALPFRFLAAVKHAPQFAAELSEGMCAAISGRLEGDTAVIIDVSGSMDNPMSAKSQMTYVEAASALAVLVRELAPSCRVFTFSDRLCEVPNWRGLALVQQIHNSQRHHGTYLAKALQDVELVCRGVERIIVITDEQSHDGIAKAWAPRSYLINVAANEPALSTDGGWQRISGWSERVIDWIAVEESGRILSGEDE